MDTIRYMLAEGYYIVSVRVQPRTGNFRWEAVITFSDNSDTRIICDLRETARNVARHIRRDYIRRR